MENGSLIKAAPLDSGNIDYGSYTASLVREACRVGLLDDDAMQTVQSQLLALLRAQISGVTHGESTSVPAEIADGLMDGIGFCVDLALKSAPSLEASLASLQTEPIDTLYRKGAGLLNDSARACQSLLARVRSTRVKTVNAGYNIVLDTTLPQLLREWKANPYPHDFALITEYPLARETHQDGIFGIHAQLSALALENRFCARFADGLDALLADYARQNRVSPADAYVNLFSIALQNLLLNRMRGQTGLKLDAAGLDGLWKQLSPLTAEQRETSVLRAARELLDECRFNSPPLEDYIFTAARDFAALCGGADGLDAFAVISRGEQRTIHLDGARLSNDAFTEIADEILLCDTVAEKIELLRGELHSLADLCDMLGADCLFDTEYEGVFASFDAATRALILTKLPVDLTNGRFSLQGETEWQMRFLRHINALDQAASEEVQLNYHFLTDL